MWPNVQFPADIPLINLFLDNIPILYPILYISTVLVKTTINILYLLHFRF